jgi:hypothetical protein
MPVHRIADWIAATVVLLGWHVPAAYELALRISRDAQAFGLSVIEDQATAAAGGRDIPAFRSDCWLSQHHSAR